MNEAIKINSLKKSYGTHVVLNGLDFRIQRGEIFALLGVNGAGKTTSLERIEGLKIQTFFFWMNPRVGLTLKDGCLYMNKSGS